MSSIILAILAMACRRGGSKRTTADLAAVASASHEEALARSVQGEPYDACDVRYDMANALRWRNSAACAVLPSTLHVSRKLWRGGLCSSFNMVIHAFSLEWPSAKKDGCAGLRTAFNNKLEMLSRAYATTTQYKYINSTWCTLTNWNCLYVPLCEREEERRTYISKRARRTPVAYFDHIAATTAALFSRPGPALKATIDRYSDAIAPRLAGHVVALHLRRGDKASEGYRQQSSADIANEVALAAPSGAVILVMSDDPTALADIKRHLGHLEIVDIGELVRADIVTATNFGEALPFLAALHVIATFAHILVANFGSNVARFLLALMTLRNPERCREAWPNSGYPDFVDLDGLVRPRDVSDGFWWTVPWAVIYSQVSSIVSVRAFKTNSSVARFFDDDQLLSQQSKTTGVPLDVRSTAAGVKEVLLSFQPCADHH